MSALAQGDRGSPEAERAGWQSEGGIGGHASERPAHRAQHSGDRRLVLEHHNTAKRHLQKGDRGERARCVRAESRRQSQMAARG